jgi:hypothetical protein
VTEQRERERKSKPYSQKKTKYIEIDGVMREAVDVEELEEEQNR